MKNISRKLLRLLGSGFSPGGKRGSLTILIYHRVLPQPDSFLKGILDAEHFDSVLSLLKTYFNVLPLSDALKLLQEEKLPPRAICITFDDGYADNVEVALPLLKHHKLSATFFIATAYLDGGNMWNDIVLETMRKVPGPEIDLSAAGFGIYSSRTDQERYLAAETIINKIKYLAPDSRCQVLDRFQEVVGIDVSERLMMTAEDVRQLHNAGMLIGGHTVSHPILASQDPVDAHREIEEGKQQLEALINHPVEYFAYPNGKPGTDYLPNHVQAVKSSGFKGAVTTAWGAASVEDDPFQLPRFTPWDRSLNRFMLRLILNYNKKALRA